MQSPIPDPIKLPDPPNYVGMRMALNVIRERGIKLDRYRIAAWPYQVARAIEMVMNGEAPKDFLRREWDIALQTHGKVVIYARFVKAFFKDPGKWQDGEWVPFQELELKRKFL